MSKFQIKIEANDEVTQQDEFIQQELHCSLCGHELEFNHEFDFLNLKIQEQSRCPECRIQVANKDYTLH